MVFYNEYKNIKNYLGSYMDMQLISAKLLNKNLDRKYTTYLTENDDYFIAMLSNKSSQIIKRRYNQEIQPKYIYIFYLSKKEKKVYLNANVKVTSDLSLNNFLLENIFKKFKSEGILNLTPITSKNKVIEYGFTYVNLKINFDMTRDYIKDINMSLNIIDKYNMFVFDKLIDKWNNKAINIK